MRLTVKNRLKITIFQVVFQNKFLTILSRVNSSFRRVPISKLFLSNVIGIYVDSILKPFTFSLASSAAWRMSSANCSSVGSVQSLNLYDLNSFSDITISLQGYHNSFRRRCRGPSGRGGCLNTSNTWRGNSGNSSRKSTSLCAREISPGKGLFHPPTLATALADSLAVEEFL